MNDRRIVLLAQEGDSTSIVYHALASHFDVAGVVLEADVSRRELLRRRMRKLGLTTVIGQLAFRVLVVPPLARRSEARVRAICTKNGLDRSPIPNSTIRRVPSVNSPEARIALAELAPALVVVNGTRIIGKETLESVPVPFVNTHTGITPAYRGVHGGYWALTERDPEHCGVTVHRVDTGIDTGAILAQALIRPTAEDTYVTYPYLQYAAAIPILRGAVASLLDGTSVEQRSDSGRSRLWSHPTLMQYVDRRVRRGVR